MASGAVLLLGLDCRSTCAVLLKTPPLNEQALTNQAEMQTLR